MRLLKQLLLMEIPPQYRSVFRRETMLINVARAKAVAIAFVILEIPMIMRVLARADWHWPTWPGNYYLLLYAAMLILQMFFVLAFTRIERTKNVEAAIWCGYVFSIWTVGWAAAIALLDQFAYQQVTVYVAAIFAIAITPYWPPLTMASIYLLVQIPFIALLQVFQPDGAITLGHALNTSTFVVLAWTVSRTLYRNRVQDFCNQMAIRQQNEQLERINQRLVLASSTDGLTGLLNRSTLERRMLGLWEECQQSARQLAIIMIDLDSFKSYNDAYGHQAGDERLREVAAVLSASIRHGSDLVGRYGGEEFIVAMRQDALEEACLVAESIREGLQQLNIRHRASAVADRLTVSIGVYVAQPSADNSLDQFIYNADMALYQAKRNGGNQVVVQDAPRNS